MLGQPWSLTRSKGWASSDCHGRFICECTFFSVIFSVQSIPHGSEFDHLLDQTTEVSTCLEVATGLNQPLFAITHPLSARFFGLYPGGSCSMSRDAQELQDLAFHLVNTLQTLRLLSRYFRPPRERPHVNEVQPTCQSLTAWWIMEGANSVLFISLF